MKDQDTSSHLARGKRQSQLRKKKLFGKDIHLNVSPKEAAVRVIIGMGLPILFVWFQSLLFVCIISIISIYFFISGLMLFCFIKHFWNKWVLKKPEPKIADPDAPVENL